MIRKDYENLKNDILKKKLDLLYKEYKIKDKLRVLVYVDIPKKEIETENTIEGLQLKQEFKNIEDEKKELDVKWKNSKKSNVELSAFCNEYFNIKNRLDNLKTHNIKTIKEIKYNEKFTSFRLSLKNRIIEITKLEKNPQKLSKGIFKFKKKKKKESTTKYSKEVENFTTKKNSLDKKWDKLMLEKSNKNIRKEEHLKKNKKYI